MTLRRTTNRSKRTGGVYIAVLATALVVALLSMSALVGQRLQNRMIVASADMRQAQLNANSAVELAILTMKQDTNWRTTYTNGNWFIKRSTNFGTCTVNVTDPVDANLANSADDPVVVLGIGYSGDAEQRVKVTVDPRKGPLSCLRSAIAVGDAVALQGDILRANSSLISANQISASSSQVYGKVEAASISGSTYNGTTTQITSEKRPTMPDWTSVFNYYRTNGTQININSLPSQIPNLGRNISFDDDTTYWTGTATALPTATIERKTNVDGHAACGRAKNRTQTTAGASQYVDHFIKAGVSYNITLQINPHSSWGNAFRVKLATKGTGAVQTSVSSAIILASDSWQEVDVTLTAPAWSGELEYARVTIDTEHTLGSTNDFYIDNLDIREVATGKFIYRQVLSPGLNPFGGQTNSQGIYWINCNGNKVVIERSRILGTLLLVNPGANSCIGNGPISWSPAVAGYPALLVDADSAADADFSINATNRALSEKENGTNYNPAGASHEDFGQDSDTNDIYRSAIRGLVAVRDDLTFQNRALVRGQVIVGDDMANSSGELEVEYLPDSLLNPPPGFTAPYTYIRRSASAQKAVAP